MTNFLSQFTLLVAGFIDFKRWAHIFTFRKQQHLMHLRRDWEHSLNHTPGNLKSQFWTHCVMFSSRCPSCTGRNFHCTLSKIIKILTIKHLYSHRWRALIHLPLKAITWHLQALKMLDWAYALSCLNFQYRISYFNIGNSNWNFKKEIQGVFFTTGRLSPIFS